MGHAIFPLVLVAILVTLILVCIVTWIDQVRRSWGRKILTAEEIAAANCALIWELYWGATYSPAIKRRLLEPVFDGLESEDKIGNLIVDVGSGASPVTRLLKAKPGRKWICVDIAADNASSPDELRVRLDAGKVGEPGVLGLRKALIRACLFLGMDPRTAVDREQADTIMFSDILNYVDFRKVLDGFATYLKTGGRMLVINLPMRGSRALFSEKGLKNNNHLYTFLSEHHFEIEYKSFPKRPPGTADESGELIVLVARKCIPPGGRQPNE